MAAQRRFEGEGSATRTMLLDAAEQLMVEKGFTAITSRRLAERIGLTHQAVFYYFKTLDDLFIALIERNGDAFRERLSEALKVDHPLQVLWALAGDRQSARLELELKAMAVHNVRIRQSLADSIERYRALSIEALSRKMGRTGATTDLPPALAFVLESVGRYIVLDEALDISGGHAAAIAVLERIIRDLEASGIDAVRPPEHPGGEPGARSRGTGTA